jgi:hypothetical protein
VLFQRKVMFIDHWKVAGRGVDCKVRPDQCDETHVLESWTVLVKDRRNVPLRFKSYAGGSLGHHRFMPMALTQHAIVRQQRQGANVDQWTANPNWDAEGGTDFILVKRDLVGSYQPTTDTASIAPTAKACEEDFAGIDIQQPTGRAELMVVTSDDTPAIRTGTTRVLESTNGNKPTDISKDVVGDAQTLDAHRIHWRIRPEYLEEAAKNSKPVTLWVLWQWEKPIKEGPVCAAGARRPQPLPSGA